MILKIIAYFLIVIFINLSGFGQGVKYSIDLEPLKNRRVPVKFFVEQLKQSIKTSSDARKLQKLETKTSKKIRKHMFSIQTKEVKKRMRHSRKIADFHNRGKVPLSVKITKLTGNG